MNSKEAFIKAGFNVVGTENNENKLLKFLKENYPFVIKDNEINIQELKAILGLPVDEKVNGYGLNFVGRNFARAKYAQKTDKELKINKELSKDFETTQNLVLKGDNLDCLKILKNHYSGKIKCIYIDPPYNTDSDEFVYPDKFDKEEAEVLGLQNLSDDDFARMEFAFKTKNSHNGWLAFMYPRLLLARDLLSDDGVIFISIDDNEQANLKLLCDDVFGEENFVVNFIWEKTQHFGRQKLNFYSNAEYVLTYAKNIKNSESIKRLLVESINNELEDAPLYNSSNPERKLRFKAGSVKFYIEDGYYNNTENSKYILINGVTVKKGINENDLLIKFKSKWSQKRIDEEIKKGTTFWIKSKNFAIRAIYHDKKEAIISPRQIIFTNNNNPLHTKGRTFKKVGVTKEETNEISNLFNGNVVFNYSKPTSLIKYLIALLYDYENERFVSDFITLDFFAGSGTTGHAVMQLNAEDGGNRKFILVQIDEPIKEDKPAYKFCVENNLPPVISSLTIERVKRAGEKIKQEIEKQNNTKDLFVTEKKQIPDIGFKVFKIV